MENDIQFVNNPGIDTIWREPFVISGNYINSADGEHLIHFVDARATQAMKEQLLYALSGAPSKCKFQVKRNKRFVWTIKLNSKKAVFTVERDWYHTSKYVLVPLKEVVKLNNGIADHVALMMKPFEEK